MESTGTTAYLLISRSSGVANVPLLGENSWKLGRGSQCAMLSAARVASVTSVARSVVERVIEKRCPRMAKNAA